MVNEGGRKERGEGKEGGGWGRKEESIGERMEGGRNVGREEGWKEEGRKGEGEGEEGRGDKGEKEGRKGRRE